MRLRKIGTTIIVVVVGAILIAPAQARISPNPYGLKAKFSPHPYGLKKIAPNPYGLKRGGH